MAGGGNVVIIGPNDRRETQGAFVTDHALHVRVAAGGVDVNIIEVGGVPVGGSMVPVVVETAIFAADPVVLTPWVMPTGWVRDDVLTTLGEPDDSWTVGRVTSQGAVWVEQAVDVEVVQPTHDDLNANVTLQLQDTDIVAGAGIGAGRAQRIPVSEYGTTGLPNLYFTLLGLVDVPTTIISDPNAVIPCGVNAPLRRFSVNSGALRTGPDRNLIDNFHMAQVFDNVTTSATGTEHTESEARWGVVFIDLTSVGAPTNITLTLQFSNDGGTTWFNYSVGQWAGGIVYTPAATPVLDAIPVEFVMAQDVRLRAVAVGTTVENTFELTSDIETIS